MKNLFSCLLENQIINMENNYFLLSPQHDSITIERFHLCTWELRDETALIEFGIEVRLEDDLPQKMEVSLYVPWLKSTHKIQDLYNNLKDKDNCRFIFNDSVEGAEFIQEGNQDLGTILHLEDHGDLCIVPVCTDINPQKHCINIKIQTEHLKAKYKPGMCLYFRFYLEPHVSLLTTRTQGITKTSLIYDIRVNEKRNLPTNIQARELCKIKNCFVFHIIPNYYDLVFLDNKICRGIRSLEFDSFQKYLPNKRFKRDELVVIFNKKTESESYTFFSSYAKERISPTQIISAIFINLLCALLLFIANIRINLSVPYYDKNLWTDLPWETHLCIGIIFLTGMYIFWPSITNCWHSCTQKVKK